MINKELKKYIEENIGKKRKFFFFKSINREERNLNYSGNSSNVTKYLNVDNHQYKTDNDYGVKKSIARFDSDFFGVEESKSSMNIKDFIDNTKEYNSFQKTLFQMIDDRNLKDSDVYNKVHLDRRLFSKIRNDSEYHPSKETVLLLGLSLELNENEIEELLNTASYSLPKNNHYDLIMRFCFMKGIYKLMEVNDLLDQYNCKLFNY